METSEKNAAGPPSQSLLRMNPSISRWNPNDTCADEKANMSIAIATSSLLTFGVLRLSVRMIIQAQKRTMFIPVSESGAHCEMTTLNMPVNQLN